MKKALLLLALSVMILHASSQDTDKPELSRDAYLKKSDRQKTAAWILLGAGIGMMAASAATYDLDISFNLFSEPPTSGSSVDNTTSDVLAIAGVGAIVGSIPFFVAAKHNKRKAAAVSFSNQYIRLPQQKLWLVKAQPAIRLQIPL